MDYLALKIPADIKQKITAHTVKDQPEPEDGGCYPFSGENGAYKLCNTDILQIVPAAYTDVKRGHHLEGDLYCDEEALMKADPQINHRASRLRYNLFKQQYGAQMPDPRLAGDVAVVFPADLKVKIEPDA